ncbi:hypothetical protein GQ53DRAFT_870792 [Thozetella sp. PMI_491]|nr:hypothetical protein GQ53DRAFT_870792 [Thozetella sp. PMI_491]
MADLELPQDLDKSLNDKSGFRHIDLNPQTEVRLLRISHAEGDIRPRYALETAALADLTSTRYRALSYTWGLATTATDVYEITVNDQAFYVRRNLFGFLQTVTAKRVSGLFFIDAICINQLSAPEREAQVQAMASIFRNADEVIGWLGIPSQRGLEDIRALAQATRISSTKWGAAEWAGFRRLAYHRYWTRMWIVQEVLLAASMTIWCGFFVFPISLFGNTLSSSADSTVGADKQGRPAASKSYAAKLQSPAHIIINHRTRQLLHDAKQDPLAQGTHVGTMDEMLMLVRKPHTVVTLYQSRIPDRLHEILHKFGSLECSDKRDRLYGLLGLMQEHTRARIKPDYGRGIDYAYRQALKIGFEELISERLPFPSWDHRDRQRGAYLRYFCDARDAFGIPDVQSVTILREVLGEITYKDTGLGPLLDSQFIPGSNEATIYADLRHTFRVPEEDVVAGDWLLTRLRERRTVTRL